MGDGENKAVTRREVLKTALAAGAGALAGQAIGCAGGAAGGSARSSGARGISATHPAKFLQTYNAEYQRLFTRLSEAQWLASTDVSDEHTQASIAARKEFNAFAGDPQRMEALRSMRAGDADQDFVTRRQLDRAWLMAAEAPGTIKDLADRRAEAEAKHSQAQDGFNFTLKAPDQDPRPITTNEIDEILRSSTDLNLRAAAWTASKEVGAALKPGLNNLQNLRNATSRELGFSSYFGLKVADYGMSVRELMALMKLVLEQTRPLYEQLHCYAKHDLARRYGQPAPHAIPAHWLPNRWGQEWPGLVEAANLDALFAGKSPEWIIKQAEQFYVSMGFPPLPKSFWQRSDLYDLPAGSTRKKNTHASAWHMDLEQDVRSLMSVKPDAYWFNTTHHELGHIYYYLAYSRPQVPVLLREGANRAFHEGVGDLIGLASLQRPYLQEIGLMPAGQNVDQTQWMLAEAFNGAPVYLRFACGTMTYFEHDLYEGNLSPGNYNGRWWELARLFQGIEPPRPRREEYCDAASKTHINDDPAEYYDYAIGTLIVYQVHDHIARKILKQDPRACNYYNHKEVGEYLREMLALGATRDWRQVLRDFTGEDLSARAMLDYYAPLMDFLKKANAGRDVAFA